MISRLMTSKGSSRLVVGDGFDPIVRRQDVVPDSRLMYIIVTEMRRRRRRGSLMITGVSKG